MEYIKSFFFDTPATLHQAILDEDVQTVKRVLQKDIDPNAYYITQDERFKKLAEKRFDDLFQEAHIHPLILAASRPNLEIVHLLIKYNAKKNPKLKLKLENRTVSLGVTPRANALKFLQNKGS